MAKEEEMKNFDFIDEADGMQGFEDIDLSTVAIPFLKILQTLSPELNKKKPAFIEGAEEGDLVNTVTKHNYGSEIEITILKFEHVFTEWRPERGGLVGVHDPVNAERLAANKTFGKWKTKDGNDLSENYMYYVIIKGYEDHGVCIISAVSTNIPAAKVLNKLMLMQRWGNGQKAMPFHQIYKVKTVFNTNEKGDWYTFSFQFVGFVDQELYLAAKEERKLLPTKQVDYAQIEDRSGGASADSKDDIPY